MDDIVQMVSIVDIMQNVTESVDFSGNRDFWLDLVDSETIAWSWSDLVDIILAQGCFDDPVCIYVTDTIDRGRVLRFGNGHHRLTAALMCGLDEIPVVFSDADYMCSRITTGSSTKGSAVKRGNSHKEWYELLTRSA